MHVAEVDVLVGEFNGIEETWEIEAILSKEGGESSLVGIGIDFCSNAARAAQEIPHADDAHCKAPDKVQRCCEITNFFPIRNIGDDDA